MAAEGDTGVQVNITANVRARAEGIEAIQQIYNELRQGATYDTEMQARLREARAGIVGQNRAYYSLVLAEREQHETLFRVSQAYAKFATALARINSLYTQYAVIQIRNMEMEKRAEEATEKRVELEQRRAEWQKTVNMLQAAGMSNTDQYRQALYNLSLVQEAYNKAKENEKKAVMEAQRAQQETVLWTIVAGAQLIGTIQPLLLGYTRLMALLRAQGIIGGISALARGAGTAAVAAQAGAAVAAPAAGTAATTAGAAGAGVAGVTSLSALIAPLTLATTMVAFPLLMASIEEAIDPEGARKRTEESRRAQERANEIITRETAKLGEGLASLYDPTQALAQMYMTQSIRAGVFVDRFSDLNNTVDNTINIFQSLNDTADEFWRITHKSLETPPTPTSYTLEEPMPEFGSQEWQTYMEEVYGLSSDVIQNIMTMGVQTFEEFKAKYEAIYGTLTPPSPPTQTETPSITFTSYEDLWKYVASHPEILRQLFPQAQKGGVVTKETIITVGERGKKEAIIPLESGINIFKNLIPPPQKEEKREPIRIILEIQPSEISKIVSAKLGERLNVTRGVSNAF